ncbi:MAG: hypothetical protein K0B08_11865 [Bacteroidales bacterium]|nr:hypothetical protein [Bacteroidales bacterium]
MIRFISKDFPLRYIFYLSLPTLIFLYFGLILNIEPAISQAGREWTIVAIYTIPGKASGLAWDGTYLYSGLYGTNGPDDLIYQIDPSNGSYTLLCTAPQETTYGLCFDGNNFWSTDRTGSYTPAIAVEFDYSGALLSSFDLPATYMSGIEYDTGNFWVCCYYNPDGMVYQLDGYGNILTQFPSPEHQPWDICKENGYLWIADYNANMLYKIETDGTLVESHPSNGIKPAGITFDGQYLWYVDGQLSSPSTLYKVDLGGSGTPVIYIPENYHNYGIVTVGESSTWNMLVQNTGTGDLIISDIEIQSGVPVSTTFSLPHTLNPGNSVYIPLTYAPINPITLNTTVNIVTNDPVHPVSPVILTGQAVAVGPMLQADNVSHAYGPLRITASTRWNLHVWNMGNQNLEITEIIITNDAFYLDEAVELPITLGTLDTVAIGFWFSPQDDNSYIYDSVQIVNNDPGLNPFQVYLEGSGLDIPWPIGNVLWYYNIDVSYDNSPKAIISINDITGDEVADVIVGSEDNYIRCFNGNSHNIADVIWERHIYSGSVYGQNCMMAVDDINGDEFQDIIAGTAWGDRSIIAICGKTGEIIWKHDTHEYGNGGWVYQVDASYDYNSDGHPDILAATGDDANDTGPKRIYCLDALTGESIWECYTGGPNFSVIGIEDVTGDGIPDVLAGASNNEETIGKVYGINGSNGAIMWTVNMPGSSVWALAQLNDLNNDGFKDVVAGDFSGNIRLLSGVNGANLGNSGIGNSLILRFVKMDDINSDGHQDILVAHSGTNGVVISGLDASNLWLQPLADKSWCVAKTNDIDGDGFSDVMIGTLFSSNYCYFLSGRDGSVLHSINFGTPVDAINAIPDIVGDMTYEMVAGGRDGRLYCYSGGIEIPISIPEIHNPLFSFHSVAYPNPFSDQTRISFYLPADNRVIVEIYTAGAQLVDILLDQKMSSGTHEVIWNARNGNFDALTEGVYVYRIMAGNAQSSGILLLNR